MHNIQLINGWKTLSMLDMLLKLNLDFNKCFIHHILLTWHHFQISRNTPIDQWWAQACNWRVAEGSQNFSTSQASKNSENAINCALTKVVITMKNKRTPICNLNRLGSELFDRPNYYYRFCLLAISRWIWVRQSFPGSCSSSTCSGTQLWGLVGWGFPVSQARCPSELGLYRIVGV